MDVSFWSVTKHRARVARHLLGFIGVPARRVLLASVATGAIAAGGVFAYDSFQLWRRAKAKEIMLRRQVIVRCWPHYHVLSS